MSIPVPVPLAGAVKLTELLVPLPSTVKVNPLPIFISSVERGIFPPVHVALGVVELQLPLPVVVIAAEYPFIVDRTTKNNSMK